MHRLYFTLRFRKKSAVKHDGSWDARGTLAVDQNAAVGLIKVKLKFEISLITEETG
jgi:hypothetical protein